MRSKSNTKSYNHMCKTCKSWWTSYLEECDYKSRWMLPNLFKEKRKRRGIGLEEISKKKKASGKIGKFSPDLN